MKIYIIEDEIAIREELTQLLQKYGYECSSSDDFQKRPGNAGIETQDFSGDGMFQSEGSGMKAETVQGIGRGPVFPVSRYRMPDFGGMDPDLVLPARLQFEFHQGIAGIPFPGNGVRNGDRVTDGLCHMPFRV